MSGDAEDINSYGKEELKFCRDNVARCKTVTPYPAATTTTQGLTASGNTTTSDAAPSGRRKRDVPADCIQCSSLIDLKMDKGFNAVGGLGLFFSLTEVCQILNNM